MSLLDIILLAIALAMDCFAVSIVSGVLTRKNWLPRMAFLFGFFQALMPLIGWIGISFFRSNIEAYDHWIAFALLANAILEEDATHLVTMSATMIAK